MSSRRDNNVALLIIGAVLVLAGISALFSALSLSFLGPVRVLLGVLGRVGWPIALIGLGALLIVAASKPGAFAARTQGKTWRRSRDHRLVGGVLAGLAEFLGWDVALVRVLFVLLAVLLGIWPAIVAYIIAMIVVPEEPLEASSVPAPSVPPAPPAPPAPPQP